MLTDFLAGAIGHRGFPGCRPVLPALLAPDPWRPFPRLRARFLAARPHPGLARLHWHPARGAQLAFSGPPRRLLADPDLDLAQEPQGL